MEHDLLFLTILGTLFLLFSAFEGVRLLLLKGRTETALGIVVSIRTPNRPSEKRCNSKWAILRYQAGGKSYLNENPIQVSRLVKEGDQIPVRYQTKAPWKLCPRLGGRALCSLALGVLFLAAAVLPLS